ncbi:phage tail protein [Escherichia coli]|nr:phage tail protein [Escherichia coli]
MHRIDTKTAQKDKFGAGKNGFTRGNPQTGTPATDLDDDYFDMLQEELCGVVEASGASLEKGRNDQLLTALRALLLSRKNPFGDIKSDGTVKTALENLGLSQVAKKDTNNNFTGTNTFTGGVALSANTTLAGIGLQYILDGKQPINAILTALAGQTPEANKLAYFTGVDSFGLTDLSAFIRAMLGKADAAATRTYLDLGNASLRDVGTNIGQIPDMSAWTKGGPATGRWRKSPDGLIEQWGSAGISDAYGNAAVTFPIAFTSAPDFVLFGPRNVTAPTRMTSIVLDESNLRNTGFTCRCFDQLDGTTSPSTSNFYWYCRGY